MILFAARPLILVLAVVSLGGCIARTAASVVTAPVRVASKGIDLATTSQSEADRNRGRAMRHQDQRAAALDRQYRRHSQQCGRGDERACQAAQRDYDEIQRLSAPYPAPYPARR